MIIKGYTIKEHANLRGANLRGADLQGADLREANLREANLREADLREADLQGANLREADLRGAYLWGANLWGADLRGADLRGVDLRGVDLREAVIDYSICPQEGSFIAYKKTSKGVIKIEIPSDALRTSCISSRKCRASYIRVLEGWGMSPTHDNKCYYYPGGIVRAHKFNPDPAFECTGGIHFFMSKEEAKRW